ncbi:MAG: hypothetical protein ACR2GF_02750 [Acidimicrobiales bacterium]
MVPDTAEITTVFTDPTALELADDPAVRMMVACERAKGWLAQIVGTNDLEQIAEFKAQADALRSYAVNQQLGKDATALADFLAGELTYAS